jgi:hypothetical protein
MPSLWAKYLKGWKFISQYQPGEANASYNCGPTSVAMCLEWIYNKKYDPEQVLESQMGAGYQGDCSWDGFMFPVFHRYRIGINYANADGSGVAQGEAIPNKGAMKAFLWRAIGVKGHPVIMLVWEWIDGTGPWGHFEVVIGSWFKLRKMTRYYQLANPNGGVMQTLSAQELWSISQQQMMEVCATRKKGLKS